MQSDGVRELVESVDITHVRLVNTRLAQANDWLVRENVRLTKDCAYWNRCWAWTAGVLLIIVAWEIWSRVILWAFN